MKKCSAVLLLGVGALLFGAGCGGSGKAPGAGAASEPPSTQVEQPAPPETSSDAEAEVTAAPELTSHPFTADVERPTSPGRELGHGSTGATITAPTPWPIALIQPDHTTDTLVVVFTPPDSNCAIAARATASEGRGGAVLVGLVVESAPTGAHVPCGPDTGPARVHVPLDEPIDGRRIYTTTTTDTGGATAAAEALADRLIGMSVNGALQAIEDAGLTARNLTDVPLPDSSFFPHRVNIWAEEGSVVFAAVH